MGMQSYRTGGTRQFEGRLQEEWVLFKGGVYQPPTEWHDAASPQEPADKPGAWVLVPVEPTPEMIATAKRVWEGSWAWCVEEYRAMLAARPAPPQWQDISTEPADGSRIWIS